MDVPEKDMQGDKQPNPVLQGYSRGVTATMACLAVLLVIGAAIANSLPNLEGFSLPSFDRFTFPKFDHIAFPGFDRTSAPKSPRIAVTSLHEAAKPPPQMISVPIPDPAVTAALTDIQSSQRQHTVVLASLTQSSETQQADLKRISRQLSALAVQVESLAPPLTTSSIGRPPSTALIIPHRARARIIRTSRKTESPKTEPPLPPPVGPVSVGGAPLSPAPAPIPVSVQTSTRSTL
ncbi:MAG TPA: hypothetical protein VGH70_14970 [Bradyrhizobium sp.]